MLQVTAGGSPWEARFHPWPDVLGVAAAACVALGLWLPHLGILALAIFILWVFLRMQLIGKREQHQAEERRKGPRLQPVHPTSAAKLEGSAVWPAVTGFARKWWDAADYSSFDSDLGRLHQAVQSQGIVIAYDELKAQVASQMHSLRRQEVAACLTRANAISIEQAVNAFLDMAGNHWERLYDAFLDEANAIDTVEHTRLRRMVEQERIRREHSAYLESVASHGAPRITLDTLSGIQFEQLVADKYRNLGVTVTLTKASNDQGADLVLRRFGKTTVVQCKRYSVPVGNFAVQEAVAAKAHYNAEEAIVVATSDFTRSAIELARSNRVQLIGRAQLLPMLGIAEGAHER